ncbi:MULTISPECIES: hypothetical protein [Gordonia]|uniref:hypothetical protein n=1 Tax=Gordonia TaxID=2053 RepID=UPI0030FEB99C
MPESFWLLVDVGGVLEREDHPSEALARARTSVLPWRGRPWQIYDPAGRPVNYRKEKSR